MAGMMRPTRIRLLQRTRALHGGADNPYHGFARWGHPSDYGSKWMLWHEIRHPADGKWGPARYGGNATPSMGEFLLDMNHGHPTIEPMYHPKLTHKQKITRLYRKALNEFMGFSHPRPLHHWDITSYYSRQIRAEFEKNREVDMGTAEWLFVRANEYIEHKKSVAAMKPDYYPSNVYWSRYFFHNPDLFAMFPHGFCPEEAQRLLNPFHRYGIPYEPREMQHMHPHLYLLHYQSTRPTSAHNYFVRAVACIMSFWGTMYVVAQCFTGYTIPRESDMAAEAGASVALDPIPSAQPVEPQKLRGGLSRCP